MTLLNTTIIEICSVIALALQFICTMCELYRIQNEKKEEKEDSIHPPLLLDTAFSKSFIISRALL